MGKRGMLSLKLIANQKSRRTTFQKRKKSLMKKAYELSTLCDVETCVLIHGPCGGEPAAEFETWPPNRNQIEAMIRSYKSKCSFPYKSHNSSYDLHCFFSDRKKRIETERSKLRQNVEHTNPPNWDGDHHLDSLAEHQLKMLMGELDSKIGVVDGMIQFMEADYEYLLQSSTLDSESPLETEEFPEFDFDISQCQSLLEDEYLQFLVDNNPINFEY